MSDFIERSKFSCALGGALTTIAAIPKAVPIVHASGGCAAELYQERTIYQQDIEEWDIVVET